MLQRKLKKTFLFCLQGDSIGNQLIAFNVSNCNKKSSFDLQYKESNILRDFNKALAGFSKFSHLDASRLKKECGNSKAKKQSRKKDGGKKNSSSKSVKVIEAKNSNKSTKHKCESDFRDVINVNSQTVFRYRI